MEGKAIQWNWIPCVSVGPITFGEPALPIIQKYNLPLIPEFGSSEEHVYEFPDRTTIVVENRLIDEKRQLEYLIKQIKQQSRKGYRPEWY
jgi:hypothetical protein